MIDFQLINQPDEMPSLLHSVKGTYSINTAAIDLKYPFDETQNKKRSSFPIVYHHELTHFHQFVSTPFGFHVFANNWAGLYGSSSFFRKTSKALSLGDRIALPLVNYMFNKHTNPAIQQSLETGALPEYINQCAKNDILTSDYEKFLNATKNDISIATDLYNADLETIYKTIKWSYTDKELLDIPLHEYMGNAYLVSDDSIIDTIPKLKSGYPICSHSIIEGWANINSRPCLRDIKSYINFLKEQNPSDYTDLFENFVIECIACQPEVEKYPGILISLFLLLCEVSLFGPCIPQQRTLPEKQFGWKDVYPGWRFLIAFENCLSHSLIDWFPDLSTLRDRIFKELQWPDTTSYLSNIDHANQDFYESNVPHPCHWYIDLQKRTNHIREKSPAAFSNLYFPAYVFCNGKEIYSLDALNKDYDDHAQLSFSISPPFQYFEDSIQIADLWDHPAHRESVIIWQIIQEVFTSLFFRDYIGYPFIRTPKGLTKVASKEEILNFEKELEKLLFDLTGLSSISLFS